MCIVTGRKRCGKSTAISALAKYMRPLTSLPVYPVYEFDHLPFDNERIVDHILDREPPGIILVEMQTLRYCRWMRTQPFEVLVNDPVVFPTSVRRRVFNILRMTSRSATPEGRETLTELHEAYRRFQDMWPTRNTPLHTYRFVHLTRNMLTYRVTAPEDVAAPDIRVLGIENDSMVKAGNPYKLVDIDEETKVGRESGHDEETTVSGDVEGKTILNNDEEEKKEKVVEGKTVSGGDEASDDEEEGKGEVVEDTINDERERTPKVSEGRAPVPVSVSATNGSTSLAAEVPLTPPSVAEGGVGCTDDNGATVDSTSSNNGTNATAESGYCCIQ